MYSGSFDIHAYSEVQDLKQRLEFLKAPQAEIGGQRSQFSEEM